MREILGIYNLHAYIKQHGILIYCNMQVQSSISTNVSNITNIISIDYGSAVIDMQFSG